MTLFTFCSQFPLSPLPKVSNSMFLIERKFFWGGNVMTSESMYVSSCVVKVELMHLNLVIAQYIFQVPDLLST